jgi:hypothetical protein
MKGRLAAAPWHAISVVASLALFIVGLIVLYEFNPSTHRFYPICLLHATTGLECPGCGTQRALHQLVHGNFLAAWRLNPFTMSLLPVGLWLGTRELIWLATGRRLPGLVTRPIFAWVLLGGLLAFGVLRNVCK